MQTGIQTQLPSALRATWESLKAYGRIARAGRRLLPGSDWNAARLLSEQAARSPEADCLLFEGHRISYRDADRRVNQLAHEFEARGIGPGDKVALLMDNRPEFLLTLTAIGRLRGVGALINTNITGDGLVHALEIAGPSLAVVGAEHASKVTDVLPRLSHLTAETILVDGEPNATAGFAALRDLADAREATSSSRWSAPVTREPMCFIYTSGTTGLPKAAIITNQRFMMASNMFGRAIFESTPGKVIYCALPLYHSNAMFGGWGAALNTGAALALRRKFSASAFWGDIRNVGATHFIYIGELCRYLLNQPAAATDGEHRLEIITGNGLRPDIWQEFQQRFRIPLIREFYGATEGNLPLVNYQGIPGMIGRLGPGQIVVRCDPVSGEIQRNDKGLCDVVRAGERGLALARINAISRFDGYVDEQATQKKILENVLEEGDRYFNTGDVFELHPDGWVAFADRIGDTFRWKGENVSTNEVAEALNGAPGVLESNVYGVEVPGADGRAGMASLVCDDDFDLEAFAERVRNALPGYQRPYFLRVQRNMRVTGTFKHQKVDYRSEGYDPERVGDPLYFLDGNHYIPLDTALHDRIVAGEIDLR